MNETLFQPQTNSSTSGVTPRGGKLPSRGRGFNRGRGKNTNATQREQTDVQTEQFEESQSLVENQSSRSSRGKSKPSRGGHAKSDQLKEENREGASMGSRKRIKTKIIVRNLPYNLTQENFIQQLPQKYKMPPTFSTLHPSIIDWFYYAPGSVTNLYTLPSVAYLNFTNTDDLVRFSEEVNGMPFSVTTIEAVASTDGVIGTENTTTVKKELKCLIEFAPFQKISNDVKGMKDPRMGTIEQDEDYIKFLEEMDKPVQKTTVSAEKQLEISEEKQRELLEASGGVLPEVSTPLLDALISKSAEKEKKKKNKKVRKPKEHNNPQQSQILQHHQYMPVMDPNVMYQMQPQQQYTTQQYPVQFQSQPVVSSNPTDKKHRYSRNRRFKKNDDTQPQNQSQPQ
jgi:hypothetical protein